MGNSKSLLLMLLLCTIIFAGCSVSGKEEDLTINTSTSETVKSSEQTASDQKEVGGRLGGGLDGGGSIDTSEILYSYTDIAYGTQSETQKLDIYLPNEGEGPYPVIIAFHGGGFMMGSKTGGDLTAMLEGVNHGYAVVTVDYRLSGEAVFPAAINDAKAAVRFVKAHAEEYNLDADSVAVWGDSAGGNLAALVGTSGDAEDDFLIGDNTENLEYSSDVQAVVDWFGPLEFLKMDEQFAETGITPIMGETSSDSSAESKYIGGNITENEELTEKANPANYISETDPYFFIQHGTADQNVPTQQSVDFAEKLTNVLGEEKVTLILLEGVAHGGKEYDTEENLEKVFGFLDKILKR